MQAHFMTDQMRGASACRLFQLVRTEDETGVSGTGVVAYGVTFPDGTVVLRWDTRVNSTVFCASLADMKAIHGHGGRTVVEWLSPESIARPVRWNVCPDCGDRHEGGAACHPELQEAARPEQTEIEQRAVEAERAAIISGIKHFFAASDDPLYEDVEVLCGRIERGEYGARKEAR